MGEWSRALNGISDITAFDFAKRQPVDTVNTAVGMGASTTRVNCLSFAMQKSELLRACATARQFSPHLYSIYLVVALERGTAR